MMYPTTAQRRLKTLDAEIAVLAAKRIFRKPAAFCEVCDCPQCRDGECNGSHAYRHGLERGGSDG